MQKDGKGIDEILMRTEYGINGNQPFYYQQDHEGSVTHLTNNSGNVIEKYRYDVFGNPVTIYSAGFPMVHAPSLSRQNFIENT